MIMNYYFFMQNLLLEHTYSVFNKAWLCFLKEFKGSSQKTNKLNTVHK